MEVVYRSCAFLHVNATGRQKQGRPGNKASHHYIQAFVFVLCFSILSPTHEQIYTCALTFIIQVKFCMVINDLWPKELSSLQISLVPRPPFNPPNPNAITLLSSLEEGLGTRLTTDMISWIGSSYEVVYKYFWSSTLPETGLVPRPSECLLLAVWILYCKQRTLRRPGNEAKQTDRQAGRQTDRQWIPEYWKMVGWWGLHAGPWWAPGGWHDVWRWNSDDWDPHDAWGPSSGAADELPHTGCNWLYSVDIKWRHTYVTKRNRRQLASWIWLSIITTQGE